MSKFAPRNKSIAAAAAVIAFLAVGGGVASASSTATGTGSGPGSGSTINSYDNFDVATGPVTGGPLTPGGLTESVAFTVSNDSTEAQVLSSVVVTVANADGSDWTAVAGCSSLDYAVVPSITIGTIGVGDYALGEVTITMNLLDSDQSGCDLVTVPPLHIVAG